MRIRANGLVVAVALALSCGPSAAINKCTLPGGKVVFQDAPCSAGRSESIDVKPSRGKSATMPASATSAAGSAAPEAVPMTEAQRIEQQVAESQKERRLRELTQREVPGAEAAVQQNLSTCAAEQESLKNGQYRYVQNLYGKTHAAQMAAEMAAAASRCETRDRELRDRVERLKAECQKLGGCG